MIQISISISIYQWRYRWGNTMLYEILIWSSAMCGEAYNCMCMYIYIYIYISTRVYVYMKSTWSTNHVISIYLNFRIVQCSMYILVYNTICNTSISVYLCVAYLHIYDLDLCSHPLGQEENNPCIQNGILSFPKPSKIGIQCRGRRRFLGGLGLKMWRLPTECWESTKFRIGYKSFPSVDHVSAHNTQQIHISW